MEQTTGRMYLKTEKLPSMWCSGCGNGIVLSALLRAFEELHYERRETVIVSGIGCWGKADDYINTNALHTTHGRALAYAAGVQACRPDLNVVVLMGDGDGATIGGNHLIHAARRNMNLTAILVNNYNYGMTGGQFSATTPAGKITSTSVAGNPERAFDLCKLIEAAGANYVARETVYYGMRLQKYIKEALGNKGFSFIEAISPCTTLFGPKNKMKQPAAMIEWLKEKGVSKKQFEKIECPEKNGYFMTGKFVDKEEADFMTRYEKMRTRMKEGK